VKTKDKMAYIGNLVKEVRESKGISQEALCRGLCNRIVLVRLEQGHNNPEKILVDAFFQRLGISINKFGMVYVKNEYESFELRREIINAIIDGDVDWAGKQLILYEKYYEQATCKILHKQFIDVAKIIMEKVSSKKHDREIEEMIRKALCLTCPNFHEEEIMSYLLYDKEITLILLLAENLHHQGRKEEAIRLYFQLLGYMDKNVSDEEELVRLYPKTALLLSEVLLEEERYEELYICRHAIQILRENHKIYFLEELLSISLAGWEAEGSTRYLENREYYQTAINGLKELQENETVRKRDILLLSEPVSQGWLMGDQISSLRKICGLSQGKFEDICDPASISKIEHGRKPSDKHYLAIMNKIGRDGMIYYPFILSEKYALHVARGNFTRYIARKDYTNAEKALLLLEAGLDKSEPINQQYLLRSRALLDNGNGLLSREAMLDKIMDAIRITAPVNVEYKKGGTMYGKMVSEETLIGYLDRWPLTQTETIIWNNIANTKGDLGNIESKIQILSLIKKNYEKNPVSLYHNAKGYLITVDNLVNELESVDVDEAIKYCDDGIRICLASGAGYGLVDLLFTKAICLSKVEKDEKTYFKVLKQDFAIAYVLDYKAMCNLIEKYCYETFSIDNIITV